MTASVRAETRDLQYVQSTRSVIKQSRTQEQWETEADTTIRMGIEAEGTATHSTAGSIRESGHSLVNKSAKEKTLMSPEMTPAAFLRRYSDLEMPNQCVRHTGPA